MGGQGYDGDWWGSGEQKQGYAPRFQGATAKQQAAPMPPMWEEDGGAMKRQRIEQYGGPPPPPGGNGDWGKGGGKDANSSMGIVAKSGSFPPNGGAPPSFTGTPGDAFGGAPAPPIPVFLAPATMNIVPISSRAALAAPAAPGPNKQLAMQFISSPREVQTQMLQDPNVAKAILQTLSDSPQHQGGSLAGLVGALAPGGVGMPGAPPPPNVPPPPPAMLAPPPPVPAAMPQGGAWSGMITLARNKGKRLPMRSVLLHGKVSDVEVALRCAGTTFGALDITHRVPFEEVAKRAATGSLLSMMPSTAAEVMQFQEYCTYFRGKNRAGVAKLDGELSLYVLPPCDDVAVLRDSVYALNPSMIPRTNCLLGLISASSDQMLGEKMPVARAPPAAAAAVPAVPDPAPATAPEVAPPVSTEAADGAAADQADAVADKDAAPDDREGGAADGAEDGVSQKEILDLFSNPELIKLLSDEGAPDS